MSAICGVHAAAARSPRLTSALSSTYRHSKLARAFVDDLVLSANLFVGFYAYGRERIFLESLNFFLEVCEYRELPYWDRLRVEQRLFAEYVASSGRHMVNLEGRVVQRVKELSGLGRCLVPFALRVAARCG